MREDERALRRITNAILQHIVILDPDGRPIYANHTTLDYTGLTMADVVRADFRARIFHPDDLERVRDQRQAALAAGVPFEFELRGLSKQEPYRWSERARVDSSGAGSDGISRLRHPTEEPPPARGLTAD